MPGEEARAPGDPGEVSRVLESRLSPGRSRYVPVARARPGSLPKPVASSVHPDDWPLRALYGGTSLAKAPLQKEVSLG